ncbi:unnamed protein product [Heterotrigona itama]|uniref:Endonuclease/exonuclease/phosphatase domain-containing protein n=1 Tax=Heterotrigona itama TaxID=395501 RepID=A0A6V7GTV4_9HYME|nr:unnamed protein product [Heterotrigona itama]
MAERGSGLVVVAETHRIPDHSSWIGDTLGSVALVRTKINASIFREVERGGGYVVARWSAPLNATLSSLQTLLKSLRDCVARRLPQQILVLGDFNANSTIWGSTQNNSRGDSVNWIAGLLLNTGRVSTCVRWHGRGNQYSIVGFPHSSALRSGVERGGGDRHRTVTF